ncbi:MAG: TolB family protein [Thiohalomonadales bacterium]
MMNITKLKNFNISLLYFSLMLLLSGYSTAGENKDLSPGKAKIYSGEKHFKNLKQLTFGGENAEAYFSLDNKELIFQSTRNGLKCDAIFRMKVDGSDVRQISSGKGVTTCSFIAPDNKAIIYASTHLGGDSCPPKPDHSQGYVWALYSDYDIFKADPDGSNLKRLTKTDKYDAEAVYSPQGDKIIFTSLRTNDLELFIMDSDGNNVKQITNKPGYDGGAFFSRDGKWIVWRASRPEGKALKDYQKLLSQGLISPGKLELYIMKLNNGKPIQLTNNGAANFGPYWHPNGKQIIFASNMSDPKGRNFDLYTINIDTRKIIRITNYEGFDGFPMFSYDGKKLVFASNRNGRKRGETNVFIVDWVN